MKRLPIWLHQKLPTEKNLNATLAALKKHKTFTVCNEAKCPNRLECYSKKTATFLALGNYCTRKCGFCNVAHHPSPIELDLDEPKKIAACSKELGLKHIVITMVCRDDLFDEGANQLAKIIKEVKKENLDSKIEVLTGDFSGKFELLDIVLKKEPFIFNHNIETTRSLTPKIRYKAEYDRSLQVLKYVKQKNSVKYVKSGLMVGLGETLEDVKETLIDLRDNEVDIITIGQYLQPSKKNLAVKRFVEPKEFEEYARFAKSIGIKHVFSAPLVRSSYNADQITN
ncbi:MAG: lipoyl synthase [Chlamydiae bacterium]|nr:lipoyl synthase [Chlamydiota bacterium]